MGRDGQPRLQSAMRAADGCGGPAADPETHERNDDQNRSCSHRSPREEIGKNVIEAHRHQYGTGRGRPRDYQSSVRTGSRRPCFAP